MIESGRMRTFVGFGGLSLGLILFLIPTYFTTICADPGGCGVHVQYWKALDWTFFLTGLALVGSGLVLVAQAFRRPR
jgi:hypothetical protein